MPFMTWLALFYNQPRRKYKSSKHIEIFIVVCLGSVSKVWYQLLKSGYFASSLLSPACSSAEHFVEGNRIRQKQRNTKSCLQQIKENALSSHASHILRWSRSLHNQCLNVVTIVISERWSVNGIWLPLNLKHFCTKFILQKEFDKRSRPVSNRKKPKR